jgi:Cys-tRNA(Pro) deacylase
LDRGVTAEQPAPSVVAALEDLGLPYRVITHTAPVRSLEEAAAARGVDVVDVVKTLVVRRGEDDYLFVLVPGGRSISWPKLRGLLGINRMSMPPADEAFAATGFVRGTITPIGSSRAWPVVADVVLTSRGEITLGSGAHDVAIGVDALALVEATAAVVADVTDPEA